MRFSGFSAHVEAMAVPLAQHASDNLVRIYFSEKLESLAEFSCRNPEAAHDTIATTLKPCKPLWRDLVLTACGNKDAAPRAQAALEQIQEHNPSVVGDCLLAVSRLRPQEGERLFRHAFAHANLSGRMALLSKLTLAENVGSPQLLGELFVTMMERATREDREEVIYPAMYTLISSTSARRSPRIGFLAMVFRGWLNEGHDEGHADLARLSYLDHLVVREKTS